MNIKKKMTLKDFDGCNEPETIFEVWKRARSLNTIKFIDNILPFIDWLKTVWAYADCGYFKKYKYKGDYYIELHTAGWSDNERIIDILQPTYFWLFFWRESRVGGHYKFKIGKEIICQDK